MLLSVVIPIYQRQSLGERALRSALAQDLGGQAELEVVAVDDASPQPFSLPEDLRDDPRVRVIRHAVNLGAAGARNTGIAAARGDYIALLDSDDLWLAGKLARQLRRAVVDRESSAQKRIYATGFLTLHGPSGRVEALIPAEASGPADFASGVWFMPGSTVLAHREVFALVGPADTSLRRLEDLDWFLRAGLAGVRLVVEPVIGAVIEVGARPSFAAVNQAARAIASKWAGDPALPNSVRRRLWAYLDLERAAAARYQGDWPRTLLWLASSFLRVPRLSLPLRRFWTKTRVDPTWLPTPTPAAPA